MRRIRGMARRLKRWHCRYFHAGGIMFAGGRTYECVVCGEQYEHPGYNGPLKARDLR
jgi:hypothetical protein